MFLLLIQAFLIILRVFLSINVAALNVGGSAATKAAESKEEDADSAVEGKTSSTALKGVGVLATASAGGLKVLIKILDIIIAISLVITLLVLFMGALMIVITLVVGSFVSLNFFENCEETTDAKSTEVVEVSDKDSKKESAEDTEKSKEAEKKKQKECTPLGGSSADKKDSEEAKEEKPTGGGANSDVVNGMIAYFNSANGTVFQDCTDAVQNALDAVGIMPSRAKGGYDMGPQHSDWITHAGFTSMGALPQSEWQAGDILSVPGHVYMYLGDGMYGHGGWAGNNTIVNNYVDPRQPTEVARYMG